MDENQPLDSLPDKPFFKIGEVASFLGVKPYILRYWESEFQSVSPRKAGTGKHRKYYREDVALLHTIKTLLHNELYTIPGARKRLAELQQQGVLPMPAPEAGQDDVTDPLEGAQVAALEQQVELLRTRCDKAQSDRAEALEAARQADEALREVDAARVVAEEEVQVLRAQLERAAGPSKEEVQRLQTQLDVLRTEHKALKLEHASLTEALRKASQPTQATPSGKKKSKAKLPREAAVAVDELALQELRNKLRYQVSSRQRLLRQLRQEAQRMMELVQP